MRFNFLVIMVYFLHSGSGGHVVGKFPPHEAFPIGGTNSVRGYEEGAVGSGRSYAVGSGEISFPVVNLRFIYSLVVKFGRNAHMYIYYLTLQNAVAFYMLLVCILQTGPVEGAIFADYGTDLGSGSTVPGSAIVPTLNLTVLIEFFHLVAIV